MNHENDQVSYKVFEYTKNHSTSVAMNYEELEKLCMDFDLPMFTLQVDRIAQMGITESVDKRYRTWFTVFQGWSFYASKYVDEKEAGDNVG